MHGQESLKVDQLPKPSKFESVARSSNTIFIFVLIILTLMKFERNFIFMERFQQLDYKVLLDINSTPKLEL